MSTTTSIDLRRRSRGIAGTAFGLALVLVAWFAGAITVESCHYHGGAVCFRLEIAVAKARDLVDLLTGG
jgi:hypothetical protein